MKKKLIKALSYLKRGEMLNLYEDTFLTGDLDGSDKLYGFYMSDQLMVVERSGEYPVTDMSSTDLTFIFTQSDIFSKICNKSYDITLVP